MDRRQFATGFLTATALAAAPGASGPQQESAGCITDVAGIRVGHFTDKRRPTGCTAILFDSGAVVGCDIRGSAASTRGVDALSPLYLTQKTDAIVLSGGSAFGLDTVSGVMRYLEEHRQGFHIAQSVVPQVAGAIIFDLGLGDQKIRPDEQAGYEAARVAAAGPVAEGNVGAGAGATVGKLFGMKSAMKTGLGTASIRVGSTDVIVAAIVTTNAVGDIYDPSNNRIIAGARNPDGPGFRNTMSELLKGYGVELPAQSSTNTTIGLVATNAPLDRVQATKVAQMAHDGMARAINPTHTLWDGDTLFAASTGTSKTKINHSAIGAIAAEVLARAIVRSATQATSLPGLPAWRDLHI
jgi:L-aminopeptidase/D-esterase-like protein